MKRLTIAILASVLVFAGCRGIHDKSATDEISHTGDYVPRDLDDCIVQLNKYLDPTDIEKMKSGSEDDMGQYHFSLGMGLREAWGLWRGSRLGQWFNTQGIFHPDDMSGIILDSFWRQLNGKPIRLEEQVKHYQDYWKKQRQDSPANP